MLTAAGIGTTRTEIAILGEAFMLMRILAECRHQSVLQNFPARMLQSHFPLATLSLQVKPIQRNIYLWCRTTLLEDPAFVEVKEAILEYAVKL